jgi:hypothetical protein
MAVPLPHFDRNQTYPIQVKFEVSLYSLILYWRNDHTPSDDFRPCLQALALALADKTLKDLACIIHYGVNTLARRCVVHLNRIPPPVHKSRTKRLFLRAGIVEHVMIIARHEDSPQVRSPEISCAGVVAAMDMACSRRGYVTPVALPTTAVGFQWGSRSLYVASTLPLIGKADLFVRFVSGSSNIFQNGTGPTKAASSQHWNGL